MIHTRASRPYLAAQTHLLAELFRSHSFFLAPAANAKDRRAADADATAIRREPWPALNHLVIATAAFSIAAGTSLAMREMMML